MKQVLAYKKHSAGIMYIALTIVGMGLVASGITGKRIFYGVIGAGITVACAVLSYRYLSLPSQIIALSGEHSLLLPKGITISLSDVCDVSYRRASAMGIQYRWGSVTLVSKFGTYRYAFVADCEEVSKNLAKLVLEEKIMRIDRCSHFSLPFLGAVIRQEGCEKTRCF